MRVGRGDPIQALARRARQPRGQNDVPHPLGARPQVVAVVVHIAVGVVDLEESRPLNARHVLGGQGPLEVRMIDLDQHGLAGLLLLLEHRVDVVLQDLGHGRAALRGDQVQQVDGVQMGLVGDLLGLDHQEPPRLLEQAAKLGEGLEPDFGLPFLALAGLDPAIREPREVPLERGLLLVRHLHPSVADGEPVVVGQRQEVVAAILVPLCHHLGEIVAVAPEGVGVQIALPPSRLGLFRPGGGVRGPRRRVGDQAGGRQHAQNFSPRRLGRLAHHSPLNRLHGISLPTPRFRPQRVSSPGSVPWPR